jgi:hypothetical protein
MTLPVKQPSGRRKQGSWQAKVNGTNDDFLDVLFIMIVFFFNYTINKTYAQMF